MEFWELQSLDHGLKCQFEALTYISSMRYRVSRISLLFFSILGLFILACQSPPDTASLEENKSLVRQWLADIDDSGGSVDFIDRWMTSDFQTYFNSSDPMDLAGYRQFMTDALSAFSNMRHDIRYVIAEHDLVAIGVTLHMVHTGEYMGIAPTGRPISIEEILVVQLREGRIAQEWAVVDFAALQRQLEPAPS